MGKVVVMDHPLIQHKIGIMRRTDTGSKDFRTLVSEVAMLECYEATRDLELTDVEIETPLYIILCSSCQSEHKNINTNASFPAKIKITYSIQKFIQTICRELKCHLFE